VKSFLAFSLTSALSLAALQNAAAIGIIPHHYNGSSKDSYHLAEVNNGGDDTEYNKIFSDTDYAPTFNNWGQGEVEASRPGADARSEVFFSNTATKATFRHGGETDDTMLYVGIGDDGHEPGQFGKLLCLHPYRGGQLHP